MSVLPSRMQVVDESVNITDLFGKLLSAYTRQCESLATLMGRVFYLVTRGQAELHKGYTEQAGERLKVGVRQSEAYYLDLTHESFFTRKRLSAQERAGARRLGIRLAAGDVQALQGVEIRGILELGDSLKDSQVEVLGLLREFMDAGAPASIRYGEIARGMEACSREL